MVGRGMICICRCRQYRKVYYDVDRGFIELESVQRL